MLELTLVENPVNNIRCYLKTVKILAHRDKYQFQNLNNILSLL